MLLSATLFIVIATAMAVINHIYIKLPSSIGLMVGSLVASLLMMLLVVMGANAPLEFATSLMGRIDVESLIMDGMLSFLLFAGALHVDFNALNKQRSVIIALASAGVIITKADELRQVFEGLGIRSKYGASTTWISKLLPRIEGGGGGGCPILVFGITKQLYVEE